MNSLLYNTNGFAFHRLDDAARALADLGYDGVALTPDVHHLDPTRATAADVEAFRGLLASLRLSVVVETGARFVLDAKRKHRPSLIDAPPEASVRLDFLRRCVDLAEALGAPVVSVWSGSGPDDLPPAQAFDRLVAGLSRLCAHATSSGVRIGFEPEPGMFVETAAAWPRLRDAVASPVLGLTLDVGHCLATREGDPATVLATHAKDLVVVQLDDHKAGVHEHLPFGTGEVRFADVARAVASSGYAGPLEVELSRQSSNAYATAKESMEFLHRFFT